MKWQKINFKTSSIPLFDLLLVSCLTQASFRLYGTQKKILHNKYELIPYNPLKWFQLTSEPAIK